jgi:Immunity protein Imm1
MIHDIYFDEFFGPGWPSQQDLEPYFFPPPNGRGWFHGTGNDSGSLSLKGIDGTEHLPFGKGRADIRLSMWGNPDLGVLIIYSKLGGGHQEMFSSKGDLTRLKEWVRSTHDTPLPVGLFIPFGQAWLAVKEFMASEGQLPTSIEWIANRDLPEGTFPDP